MVTLERLKEVLQYNQESGQFIWLKRRNNTRPNGSVAGRVNHDGYVQICIDKKTYQAHRLAWFYTHGVWPNVVDHINGNKTDNSLTNLRSVTHGENSQNRREATPNKSTGFLGVTKKGNRFQATISVNHTHHYLGLFQTPEAAHEAYLTAKRSLHPASTL